MEALYSPAERPGLLRQSPRSPAKPRRSPGYGDVSGVHLRQAPAAPARSGNTDKRRRHRQAPARAGKLHQRAGKLRAGAGKLRPRAGKLPARTRKLPPRADRFLQCVP